MSYLTQKRNKVLQKIKKHDKPEKMKLLQLALLQDLSHYLAIFDNDIEKYHHRMTLFSFKLFYYTPVSCKMDLHTC